MPSESTLQTLPASGGVCFVVVVVGGFFVTSQHRSRFIPDLPLWRFHEGIKRQWGEKSSIFFPKKNFFFSDFIFLNTYVLGKGSKGCFFLSFFSLLFFYVGMSVSLRL